MSRKVERSAVAQPDARCGTRQASRVLLSALAVGPFLLSLSLRVQAQGGDGHGDGDVPDLAKPTEMPPIVSTPAKPNTPARPMARSGDRAVLALPGITKPTTPRPSADPSPGGILLDAPLEMGGGPSATSPTTPPATPNPSRGPRPLVLEAPSSEEPAPIDGPKLRPLPEAKKPTTSSRVVPQPAPQPQRRGRLFGLLPGPAPAPRTSATPGSATNPRTVPSGRAVVEGTPADPAGEASLKRKIEKQARDALGNRARSVEVRIVGKTAVIQARGVGLFQKRGVRKSLETLPALSGMQSSIEVLD